MVQWRQTRYATYTACITVACGITHHFVHPTPIRPFSAPDYFGAYTTDLFRQWYRSLLTR